MAWSGFSQDRRHIVVDWAISAFSNSDVLVQKRFHYWIIYYWDINFASLTKHSFSSQENVSTYIGFSFLWSVFSGQSHVLQIEDVFVESIGANICTVIGLKSSLSNVCKGNRILPNWLKPQLIVNEGGRHPAAPGSNPKHTNYAFL